MVPCRTLASIFAEYGIRHIDFFSLDVEGFEAEVLSTINFNRVTIDVLITEIDKLSGKEDMNSEKNKKVAKILQDAGMFQVPSKYDQLPDCTKKARAGYLYDLHGSAVFVSKKFRDDICDQ